jgi:hypothetical protein
MLEIKRTPGQNLDLAIDKTKEIGKGMAKLWSEAKDRMERARVGTKANFEKNKSNAMEPKPAVEPNVETGKNSEIKQTRKEAYEEIKKILEKQHPKLMGGLELLKKVAKPVAKIGLSVAGLTVAPIIAVNTPILGAAGGGLILATTVTAGLMGAGATALKQLKNREWDKSKIVKNGANFALMGFTTNAFPITGSLVGILATSGLLATVAGSSTFLYNLKEGKGILKSINEGGVQTIKVFAWVNCMPLGFEANILATTAIDKFGNKLSPLGNKIAINTSKLLGTAATGIKTQTSRLATALKNIEQKSTEIIVEPTFDKGQVKDIVKHFTEYPQSSVKRLIDGDLFEGGSLSTKEQLAIIDIIFDKKNKIVITTEQRMHLLILEHNIKNPGKELIVKPSQEAELENPTQPASTESTQESEIQESEEKEVLNALDLFPNTLDNSQ